MNFIVNVSAVASICAFCMMGADKHRAAEGDWRIPERTLFIPVLLGGGIGGWLGMRYYHHKTQKPKFAFGIPFITILQLAAYGFLKMAVNGLL